MISNANLICQLNQETLTYSIDYNGIIYNGFPVVSIEGKVGLSYLLEKTNVGFDLTINKYGSAVKCAFNFIVADLKIE
jgi:hypothetical protein